MIKKLKQTIGAQVLSARRAKDWTQSNLAEKIERSIEAISNIERGVSLPTLETLRRIADVTGMPIKSFFDLSPLSDVSENIARRNQLERLKRACDKLSDADLAIAVEQVEALVRKR